MTTRTDKSACTSLVSSPAPLRPFAVALLALAVACGSSSEPDGTASADDELSLRNVSGDTVLVNASVVDPSTRTKKVGAVVVERGAVKEVLWGRVSASSIARHSASGMRIVDLRGKWLLPGLSDLHTHLFFGNSSPHGFEEASSQDNASQEQLGNRYLHAGVTTYLDLFSPNDAADDPATSLGGGSLNIFDLRARERSGQIVHPRSFVAGPLFMVPGSHGVENFAAGDVIRIDVKDAQGQPLSAPKLEALTYDVKRRVEQLIDARHPDVIKIVYDNHADAPADRPDSMPFVIANAILAGAKGRGVKTVAHVGSWAAVEQLAKAGLTAFTHLPNGAAPASTLAALKANGTTAISTMAIYQDYGDMATESLRSGFTMSTFFRSLVPPGLVTAYGDFAGYTSDERGWVLWGDKHNRLGSQEAAFASLLQARVPILPGTDSGNTGALYGFSLSRELIRFEAAGMPRWDALRAATIDAQRFLGQERRGAIAPGFDADLIAVDGDPLESLANLQKVSTVMLRGKLVDRAALDLGVR
ncbi:MAG: amidohydrolase family protein [Deltaproteobacteria bacterium]|nr:amidohydrolase family protein [Deltaproteobacteria bacterium]